MTSALSQSDAHLIGLWFQLLATGAYWVYVPQCFIILRRKVRDGLSIWFPAVCVLIFLITTADLVIELIRTYAAYATHGSTSPDPALFFSNPSTFESLLKNGFTVSLAIISDVIMVYRVFNVWGHNLPICLIPAGLLLGNVALGIWSVWTLAQTHTGNGLILALVTTRVRYFFVLTFCLNMLCSVLICWRIWRVNAGIAYLRDWSAQRVIEVVIETAALYCAHLFTMIVSISVGSNVFFIFLDPLPPVTALVFSMLIVRTRTREPKENNTTMELSTTFRFWHTNSQAPPDSMVVGRPDAHTHSELGIDTLDMENGTLTGTDRDISCGASRRASRVDSLDTDLKAGVRKKTSASLDLTTA